MNELKTKLTKEIPYKWRVQSFSKFKPSASCVAYIDARDVMDLLDDAVGIENWQSDYKSIGSQIYAGLGIKVNNEWVWKWDVGAETDIESEKGQASDAFKRAAVKWGIGRFLYNLDIKYLPTNGIKGDADADKGGVIYKKYPSVVHPVTHAVVYDITKCIKETSKK